MALLVKAVTRKTIPLKKSYTFFFVVIMAVFVERFVFVTFRNNEA